MIVNAFPVLIQLAVRDAPIPINPVVTPFTTPSVPVVNPLS